MSSERGGITTIEPPRQWPVETGAGGWDQGFQDRPRRRRHRTAGLLVLLAVVLALPVVIAAAGGMQLAGGSATPAPAPTLVVHLTAKHSRFTPAAVEVPAGATVRFEVENLDPIDHELIVGGPEVHQRHEVGREAHHHGEVPGEISAPAGQTVSTTWTAPDSPGPVTFACHIAGHLAYGMAGVVTVTAVPE